MGETKTLKLHKRSRLPLFRIIIVFLVTFLVSTTVAVAANGFYKVVAEDNHIIVIDDTDDHIGGGDIDMKLTIAGSMYGDYQQTIRRPLEVKVFTSEDSYQKAGNIFVRNESDRSGTVRHYCKNTGGGYLNEVLGLKVTGSNSSEIIYEGTLKDYCLNNKGEGNFKMDDNETKKLVYYFKFKHVDGFKGVTDVYDSLDDYDNPNNYDIDQINFDLTFEAVNIDEIHS